VPRAACAAELRLLGQVVEDRRHVRRAPKPRDRAVRSRLEGQLEGGALQLLGEDHEVVRVEPESLARAPNRYSGGWRGTGRRDPSARSARSERLAAPADAPARCQKEACEPG
jgi:hypothetical protein